MMKKAGLKFVRSLLIFLFWILVWYCLASFVRLDLILPTPDKVAIRLIELMGERIFYETIFLSFLRIISGFLLGCISGIALGILCAKSSFFDAILSPIMGIVKAMPVASFIIMVILWIEKESVPTFISFLMVMPILWESAKFGVRSLPKDILEMAKVYHIRGWKKIKEIYFPLLLPFFMTGFQTSLGLAWKAGVAAEVLALPKKAIGYYVYTAKLYLETSDLYAWTAAILIISLLLEKLMLSIFKKRDRRQGNA